MVQVMDSQFAKTDRFKTTAPAHSCSVRKGKCLLYVLFLLLLSVLIILITIVAIIAISITVIIMTTFSNRIATPIAIAIALLTLLLLLQLLLFFFLHRDGCGAPFMPDLAHGRNIVQYQIVAHANGVKGLGLRVVSCTGVL